MGEGVFGNIVKGPVHQQVDAIVNDPAKRAAFLAGLRSASSATTGAEEYCKLLEANGLDPRQADYLRRWWYIETLGPDPKRWPNWLPSDRFWPWLQPIYPILRRGLIKAIEVADGVRPALPIDSYWSPGGTQVQVFVTQSKYQVTRIILTPATPPPTLPHTKEAPLWVVRRGASSLTPGYSTGQESDEVVESVEGNVITWRIRDFGPPLSSSV